MTPYKIFYSGENSEFFSGLAAQITGILSEEGVDIEPVPKDLEKIKNADLLVFSNNEQLPNVIQVRAKQNGIPMVFINSDNAEKADFRLEDPVFFSIENTDVKTVSDFLTLIILFNRKMQGVAGLSSVQERMELLDEMINDFGTSLNSKLCTIIGYADFALSESSVSEMQKALQVTLEAGLDTAQLLQNMLLSVKAIIRKSARQKWVA